MRNFYWLDQFLDRVAADVYPEPVGEPHLTITSRTIESLLREGHLKPGDRVLDVGCGQGLALEQFRRHGVNAIGVTLGADAGVCRRQGFDVREMDQSFLEFEEEEAFDLLWCRHVLEHSVAPYFTLTEYHRLTRPGGRVYIEVPAPDTPCRHETNPNHYSVLPRSAWLSLIGRAGFQVLAQMEHQFDVPVGRDTYWGFLLARP